MPHERGTPSERLTPEQRAVWLEERFGIGRPPPLTPAQQVLAAEFPDDPDLEPEKAAAAIAKAQALGARIGHGNLINTVAQRRSAGELP